MVSRFAYPEQQQHTQNIPKKSNIDAIDDDSIDKRFNNINP